MNMFAPNKTQQGFSLVEAMVALVLAIVLTAGVLQVYMSSSSKYRAQEATAAMMESGRTAIELVSRSLRSAGYWNCDGWQPENVSNHLATSQRGLFATNGASAVPSSYWVSDCIATRRSAGSSIPRPTARSSSVLTVVG